MGTLNISLPDSMRAYIEDQASTGGFSTASEYVRALVRQDQKRRAEERLEALILEGIASGEPERMTPEDWKKLKQEVLTRLAARRGQ